MNHPISVSGLMFFRLFELISFGARPGGLHTSNSNCFLWGLDQQIMKQHTAKYNTLHYISTDCNISNNRYLFCGSCLFHVQPLGATTSPHRKQSSWICHILTETHKSDDLKHNGSSARGGGHRLKRLGIFKHTISAMFLIWAFWKLAGFDPLCQIKYCMKLNGIHPMNAPSPDVIWIWTFFELKFKFNDIKKNITHITDITLVHLAALIRSLHSRNYSKQQGPRCLNHSDQPHEANNTQDVGSTRGAHLPSTYCRLEDFFVGQLWIALTLILSKTRLSSSSWTFTSMILKVWNLAILMRYGN